MKIVDYHVHSKNSFDGKETVEEMCKRAIELGIYEICFTEHFSVDPRDVSFGVLDYKKYFEEIKTAQEKFSDKLKIKMGLEIGEPHLLYYKSDLKNQLKNMELDFIIGSVHNIGGKKLRLYMQGKAKHEIYYDYFVEIYKMVLNSDIDVVGHLDLMKRYAYEVYGNYKFEDYIDIIKAILKKVIEKGIGIEINGSGYENKVGISYPGIEILKLYKKLGGEVITVGSDSHIRETLGKHNEKMMNILKDTGFKSVFTYLKRKKTALRI